jgi:lipoprotein-anchoring transpeptidase ErfK/SrfK
MKILKFILTTTLVVVLSYLFINRQEVFFFLSRQNSIDPQNLSEEYDFSQTLALVPGRQIKVPSPQPDPSPTPQTSQVLSSTSGPKRIEVDLTNQRLYAYEGDKKVYDFLVSTGKYDSTPTGKFRIWIKLKYTKMSGGSKALGTYYYLPNVPYTMFFYNEKYPMHIGYGIHGAYWHSNFGHPMSHGCINMKIEEAALLYYWADPDLRGKPGIRATEDNPGTEIIIYGKMPRN